MPALFISEETNETKEQNESCQPSQTQRKRCRPVCLDCRSESGTGLAILRSPAHFSDPQGQSPYACGSLIRWEIFPLETMLRSGHLSSGEAGAGFPAGPSLLVIFFVFALSPSLPPIFSQKSHPIHSHRSNRVPQDFPFRGLIYQPRS